MAVGAEDPRDVVTIGPFTVEFIRVTHSMPDCVALAITTPVGLIVHTGDFKIDQTPIDGEHFDLHRFAELGRRGVLGAPLYELTGWTVAFTWYAAVIAATVMALPLLVRTVRAAIESVDRDLERAAYTLGRSELRTALEVTLPLARNGILAGLVLVQPDLGNCMTLIVVTFGLLYLAGSPAKHLAWVAAPALPLVVLAIWMAPYRLRRITAFMDPWSDPRGSGFQIIQSWLALGNGGIFGQGIGASRQKLFYLPESHTDFIFAIIGEELGFVGAAAIVALFTVLIWRGLRIGLRAPDPFGGYLALGITVLIATQTLVNLGVVTGLLPTKGLPLPFISFGGSALLVTMVSTGVLLNISQHAHV